MAKKILSEDSRERLVAAYEKTKDLSNVAKMFGVAESTEIGSTKKKNRLALQLSKRGVKPKLQLCLNKSKKK